MTATPPQSATDSLPSGGVEHQTLALGPALHELQRRRRPRVLDLGPAIGANVEFFAGFSAQLFIADLYRSLRGPADSLPLDPRRLERTLADQLPTAEHPPFDLILAWDLLNYFEPPQLEVLGRHLGLLCRPGGQLFALLATRGTIADQPLTFQILARDLLRYETAAVAERESPRYMEANLQRLLDAFAVQTSFLLRHGMQEYIFTRRAAALPSPPPPGHGPR